jgi:uncharacterized protein YbjT (DUF2867 family)
MQHVDIVITGGTGTVGRQALKTLLAPGTRRVRALVRDTARAKWIADAGGELAEGSFTDPEAVTRAFTGADTLALITPAGPRAFEQAATLLTLAKQAGVRKVVRLSAIKAAEDGPTDNTRQHGRTERAIRDSGLTSVILRPNYFMQNLLGSLRSVLGEGRLYAGMGNGKIAIIDARDVGDAIAAAASTDAFDGSVLELSGPQSIGHDVVAAELGRGLGRDVSYVAIPPEAAGEAMRAFGLDDWTVQVITDYARAYSSGFGDFVTGSVEALTGHPARDIAAFVREVLVPAATGAGRQEPIAQP